jgi:pSer/pThr/pTyr-binding forkhead associated (FHA) protein
MKMIDRCARASDVKIPGSPQLVALFDGKSIPIDKPITLIGRHQECDIQLPSRKISRRHCCIALVSDRLVVRDLGSTNGVRINGVKVHEGEIRFNDELTIGNLRYQLRSMEEAPPSRNGEEPENGEATQASLDDSLDEPSPLPDIPQAHPVLKSGPDTH